MLISIFFVVPIGFFILIGAVVLTPFPHWPAYFSIWRHVLFDPESSIGFKDRQLTC